MLAAYPTTILANVSSRLRAQTSAPKPRVPNMPPSDGYASRDAVRRRARAYSSPCNAKAPQRMGNVPHDHANPRRRTHIFQSLPRLAGAVRGVGISRPRMWFSPRPVTALCA